MATMTQQKEQAMIDDIMDSFDFAKVHKAMTTIGWTWGSEPDSCVPDIIRLRNAAKQLLTTAVNKHVRTSTGGFEAIYDGDVLSLAFVLEEAIIGIDDDGD